MSAVATETTCLGLTSMYSIWSGRASGNWSRKRDGTRSSMKWPSLVERRVGLGHDVLLLLVGREVLDLGGHDRADREGVGLLLLELGAAAAVNRSPALRIDRAALGRQVAAGLVGQAGSASSQATVRLTLR